VRCPAAVGGNTCGQTLKEVPMSWGRATIDVISSRASGSGRGEVLRCRLCGSWLEITYAGVLA
jgi:hypothetical protein